MARWKVQSDYAGHDYEVSMNVGDLVENLNSESRMTGIVIGWTDTLWPDNSNQFRHPVVLWADGRRNWIMCHRVEVLSESR